MKNIKALTLAFLIAIFSSSYALAEMAIGISGAIADIEAGGTETEGSEVTNGEADNQVGVVSVFVEYPPAMLGGVTLGFDYIPGSADVSSDTKSRTDTETSVTGTTTETTTKRAQSAQAEIENHMTLYATYELAEGFYVKGGYVQVDLNTLESLATGSKYGNETINGLLIGAGFESDMADNMFVRGEVSFTDYDDVSIRSSVKRTGVTSANLIEADLDVTMFKASIGYKF